MHPNRRHPHAIPISPVSVVVGSQPPLTLSFVVGSRQAAPWLDAATSGLQEGQTSSLVPGDSDDSPVVHVTLNKLTPARKAAAGTGGDESVNVSDKKNDEKSGDEHSAHALRQKGNEIIKSASTNKAYQSAYLPYCRALQAPGVDDSIIAAVHSNLSLLGLRVSDWTLAIAHADAAQHASSKLDQPASTLTKCFFRRASAYLKLNYTVAALSQFHRAHQVSPHDTAIVKERDRAREDAVQSLAKHRKAFAEVYNVMLQSPLFENPLLV